MTLTSLDSTSQSPVLLHGLNLARMGLLKVFEAFLRPAPGGNDARAIQTYPNHQTCEFDSTMEKCIWNVWRMVLTDTEPREKKQEIIFQCYL